MDSFFKRHEAKGFTRWNMDFGTVTPGTPVIINGERAFAEDQISAINTLSESNPIFILSSGQRPSSLLERKEIIWAPEVICKKEIALHLIKQADKHLDSFLRPAIKATKNQEILASYNSLCQSGVGWDQGLLDCFVWLECAFDNKVNEDFFEKYKIQPMLQSIHGESCNGYSAFYINAQQPEDIANHVLVAYNEAKGLGYLWSTALGGALSDVQDLYQRYDERYNNRNKSCPFTTPKATTANSMRLAAIVDVCNEIINDSSSSIDTISKVNHFRHYASAALTFLNNWTHSILWK